MADPNPHDTEDDPADLWEKLRLIPHEDTVVDELCEQHAACGRSETFTLDDLDAVPLVRRITGPGTCWICRFISRICALVVDKKDFSKVWKEKLPVFVGGPSGTYNLNQKLMLAQRDLQIGTSCHKGGIEFHFRSLEKLFRRFEIGDMRKVHLFCEATRGSQRRVAAAFQPERTRVDLELIKSWLRECDKHHIDSSTQGSNHNGADGIFLIDVDTRLISWTQFPPSYVALSYVCGTGPANTFDGTAAGCLPASVPQVVEDAVVVTKGLGLRYLWIDAYCIEYSDLGLRNLRINQMDDIYHGAYLTICDLAGTSAQSGLSGVSRPFTGRYRTVTETTDHRFTAVCLSDVSDIIKNSVWSTRAWTLQENALSRRRLCLHQEGFFVLSNGIIFQDFLVTGTDKHGGADYRTYSSSRFDLSLTESARSQYDFRIYRQVVQTYADLKLTHDRDGVRAVTGLFNRISLPQNTHLHGLPYHDFHNAMVWHQDSLHGFKHEPTRRVEFPSWSWLGWNTKIRFGVYLSPGLGFHETSDDTTDSRQSIIDYSVVYENLVQIHKLARYRLDGSLPADHLNALIVSTDIARFDIERNYGNSDAWFEAECLGHENEFSAEDWDLHISDSARWQQSRQSRQHGDFTLGSTTETGLFTSGGAVYAFKTDGAALSSYLYQRDKPGFGSSRRTWLEFILLQHWVQNQRGGASVLPKLLNERSEPYFKGWREEATEFQDRVYIMGIIRRPDGIAERVALLWMREKDWLAANPLPTELRLG